MSRATPPRYMCGVQKELCNGILTATNHGLEKDIIKTHASSIEAFHCARKALLRQGWEQIGSREFRSPDGGPIRVLTKPSRFGGKLRNGKEGTRNMPQEGGGILFSC